MIYFTKQFSSILNTHYISRFRLSYFLNSILIFALAFCIIQSPRIASANNSLGNSNQRSDRELDKQLIYDSYRLDVEGVVTTFENVFTDGNVDVVELKKVTHELGVLYLKLSRDNNLSTNQKANLIKPLAKTLGDSVVRVTDPLANPVMGTRFYRGNLFHASMDWVGTRFKALLRDLSQIPKLKKDLQINKIGKAPIDELNEVLSAELSSISSSEEATEVKKFFSLIVKEFERSEPYRFQTQHTLMYRIYLGMALYVALIDRWDWVGLVTWDFNTWSPVYSAASLTMLSLAFAWNRYMNSGRGVLNSYKEFVNTVEAIDDENRRKGITKPGISNWIKNLPQSCSRLLGKNT